MIDHIFLPMFIGTKEEIEQILKGRLVCRALLDERQIRDFLSKIPDKYMGREEWDVIRAGGYANFSELLVKYASLFPLFYDNGHFLRIKRRYKSIGDSTLIVLYPNEFMQRLQCAVALGYGNQYMTLITSAVYGKTDTDPYRYNAFRRSAKDRWKEEILLAVRMKPGLMVTETNIASMSEKIILEMGDLSDITVVARVNDLTRGIIPKELQEDDYMRYIDSFTPAKKEIGEWVFNVAANIMDIAPVAKWIDELRIIFPEDKWKAVSQVEKLFADGDAMPRLAFFGINGIDRVFLHINRIEFHFFKYSDEQRLIAEKLIHFAESKCKTGFCHMSLETNADLGVIKNKKILSQTHFREERTARRGELFESQCLEADYKLLPSMFGIDFARKDWHYSVRLFTPDDENAMWYDADDVMDFFTDAARMNVSRIDRLMKGDAYAGYRKI